ncbi:MAG: tRNA lysidine(34) synthetase TilS [Candidatus Limnocylindria bacterium]
MVGGSNPPSATNPSLLELARALAEGADAGRLIPDRSDVVLAVSGGPDSMALLEGAARLARDREWCLVVAHLDHRLRPGSGADAEFVRATAEARGLRFEGTAADVAALARTARRSIEEAGRDARYAFLEGVASTIGPHALIATAHTADDSAETILLNIARGTGVSGLSGIPVRRGRIVRPLLGARRATLRGWLVDAGIAFRTDETNLDMRYARARVRHEVVPALERLNPGVVEALLRLGRLAADDDRLLDDLASTELARRRLEEGDGGARIDWHEPLPRALGRRVLRLALGVRPPMERIDAILNAAEGVRGGVSIEVGSGTTASVSGRVITIDGN